MDDQIFWMKKTIYNQFRIKDIPRDEIHRDELMEIIGNVFTVLEIRKDVIRIRTKWHSPNPRTEWDLIIHKIGDSYEISIENDDDWDNSYFRRSDDARFFMKHLLRVIDKRILDRRRAFNSEQQARKRKMEAIVEKEGNQDEIVLEGGGQKGSGDTP